MRLDRAGASNKVRVALLHGPEQIADLPVSVVESPGAVRIGHPERGHLVEYLAPNSTRCLANVRVRISGPMIALQR